MGYALVRCGARKGTGGLAVVMWGQCEMHSLHTGSGGSGVGKSMSSFQPAYEQFKFACNLALLMTEERQGSTK